MEVVEKTRLDKLLILHTRIDMEYQPINDRHYSIVNASEMYSVIPKTLKTSTFPRRNTKTLSRYVRGKCTQKIALLEQKCDLMAKFASGSVV